jgi:hypothetical protein
MVRFGIRSAAVGLTSRPFLIWEQRFSKCGARSSPGRGASCLYEGHIYVERSMAATWNIFLSTLLGWHILLITYWRCWLQTTINIFYRRLNLEKYVSRYLKPMSNLFIWIYSGGGGPWNVLKGAQVIKVWKLLFYNLTYRWYFTSGLNLISKHHYRPQWPPGLRLRPWLLGRWDRGIESRLRHGCLSLYIRPHIHLLATLSSTTM